MSAEITAAEERTHPLYALLNELERAGVRYTLGRYRPNTILVTLSLVGERVEIDVFDDGHMEVSRFPGTESVVGDEVMVGEIVAAAAAEL